MAQHGLVGARRERAVNEASELERGRMTVHAWATGAVKSFSVIISQTESFPGKRPGANSPPPRLE
jgi:hypothetical protein